VDAAPASWQKQRDVPVAIAETPAAAGMEWGECWLEPVAPPSDLAAEVKKAMGGNLPNWATRLSPVPWTVRAFTRVNTSKFAFMPPELWGLIGFVVSQDNSCRYCYGATRTILRIVGYHDASIDRLESEMQLADVSPAEQAALRFARKVSQANPRPTPADLDALARAGFARPAVAEIAYSAAISCFANRLATLFALPPDPFERLLDRPLTRLLRPLIARSIRAKRGAPVDPPVPNEPPCADVVAALDGSPVAHVLRRTIDDAIASPVLPRRTKLLMLAVIGRALGCGHAVAESREGLAAAGLGTAEVDAILTNLGSPALDERERLLVPFARETVRYRNTAIQDRTRALAARLSVEEVIEAVAVASLANAVARLSVILQTC
jgi:alkylhydroperoxidase family enzyme